LVSLNKEPAKVPTSVQMAKSMNERPNMFRRVPYAEHEETHLFKVMRHFPDLAKTLPEVHDIQVKMGRNWVDQHKPGKEKPREKSYRSTRKLDELKRSAHGAAGGQMDDMRRVLLCARNPAMAKRLQEANSTRYLQNGSLSSAPTPVVTLPSTPAAMHSSSRGPFAGDYKITGNGTVGLLEDGGRKGPESRPLGAPDLHAATLSTIGEFHAAKLDKFGNDINADPLKTANAKLGKASLSYAPSAELNILAGFQGQDLNVEEFDVQLRRCLQVNLSKQELEAIFSSMDADGSGLIDGVEFTRYFLTVGNILRENTRLETLHKQRREAHRAKMHAIEEEERVKLWEQSQISQDTSVEDEQRIFQRLAKVALHWDNGSAVAEAKLVGFDAYLTPYEFKLQLEASFGLYCDPVEIGALMKRYKTGEGEHCVDGKAFLQSFSKLRHTSRVQHAKELKKFAKRKDNVLKISKYFGDTGYATLGR